MDLTSAQQAAAEVYRVLTDLGGFLAGILALIAGFLVYAGGARQARAGPRAAPRPIAPLQEQMAPTQRSSHDAPQPRRPGPRLALPPPAAPGPAVGAPPHPGLPMGN